MNLDYEVRQNTKDIHGLAVIVAELATTVKLAEEGRKEDRQDMRNVALELKSLNDKIGTMDGVQKEIGLMIGEVGKLRHDIKNIEQAQQALPILKENIVRVEKEISDHETRINSIEKWQDTTNGATGAVRLIIHAIWAFVSVGGLSFVAWLTRGYWGGGGIGGE